MYPWCLYPTRSREGWQGAATVSLAGIGGLPRDTDFVLYHMHGEADDWPLRDIVRLPNRQHGRLSHSRVRPTRITRAIERGWLRYWALQARRARQCRSLA